VEKPDPPPRHLAILAVATVLTAGCGYIGEPQPPLAHIPAKVTDLAAIQRGSRLIVQFTIPQLTTEGTVIKGLVKLDLRIGKGIEPFDAGRWAPGAKAIPQSPATSGLARYEVPAAEWTNQDVLVAVRVIGANGKDAGWSNFLVIPVVPPPERPAAVTATATAEGVRLTWRATGTTFRVFRKIPDAQDFVLAATVPKPEWIDTAAEFGKRYAYEIQTVVALGSNKDAESDLSDETSITPVDTFPPAVPAGLAVSSAANSVELVWDRNQEPDLAGYRVYRANAGGAFEKIADVNQIPSYSDHNVEHGKTYRYAITAFDQIGNESAQTAPASIEVP